MAGVLMDDESVVVLVVVSVVVEEEDSSFFLPQPAKVRAPNTNAASVIVTRIFFT